MYTLSDASTIRTTIKVAQKTKSNLCDFNTIYLYS